MSKPLLKVRCSRCQGAVASVETRPQADGPPQRVVYFRSLRRVLRAGGNWAVDKDWDLQPAPDLFSEPLGVDPGTGYGRTKAECQCHGHWLDHADLVRAIREGQRVLLVDPASPGG